MSLVTIINRPFNSFLKKDITILHWLKKLKVEHPYSRSTSRTMWSITCRLGRCGSLQWGRVRLLHFNGTLKELCGVPCTVSWFVAPYYSWVDLKIAFTVILTDRVGSPVPVKARGPLWFTYYPSLVLGRSVRCYTIFHLGSFVLKWRLNRLSFKERVEIPTNSVLKVCIYGNEFHELANMLKCKDNWENKMLILNYTRVNWESRYDLLPQANT